VNTHSSVPAGLLPERAFKPNRAFPCPRRDAEDRVVLIPGGWLLAEIALVALLLLGGCATEPRRARIKTSAPAGDVVELNLLAMPVALNLNGLRGSDGFAVKVYVSAAGSAKAVPLKSGTLEILMFDGVLNKTSNPKPKPLHTWSFPAAELSPFAVESTLGTGYNFTLPWGKDVPQQNRITVAARYVSPKGETLYSAASPITVVSH